MALSTTTARRISISPIGYRPAPTDYRTIPAEIHNVVMMLTPEERMDRAIVNEAVRTQPTPWRPAGSADEFGVPTAEEWFLC